MFSKIKPSKKTTLVKPPGAASAPHSPIPGIERFETVSAVDSNVMRGGGGGRAPSESTATGGSKKLHGKYKKFFNDQYHPQVEEWYNCRTTQAQRHAFRELVKEILTFNIQDAKKKLRTTYDADIIGANSIFRNNNGHMFSVEAAQKSVEWLSAASIAQRNSFRETFGLIAPPSMFTSKRQYDADFVPSKKFMKSEAGFDKGEHIKTLGTEHLTMPSKPHEYEQEIIAKHPTHTGTFYVWKTGASGQRGGGDGEKVVQKAHDSTFKGAPWGVYGSGSESNQSQWTSVTAESFKDTYYLQDKNDRKFQNYNDNYCHMLYRQYKNEKRARKAERAVKASGTFGTMESDAVVARQQELKVPPPNLACLGSSKYIMNTPIPEMRPKY